MPNRIESQLPTIPHRSPFRIRDSQLQRSSLQTDRWSFSMELGNMWNMKPMVKYDYQMDNKAQMMSPSNLLTQLLVSQAVLDSNEYKMISFETLEQLKKQQGEISQQIKNIQKSIELENRIRNISKSLENINLKNSRNSIIYLQNQRQTNESKITYLSKQLKRLKQNEIHVRQTILQHTVSVLNKGIQQLELSGGAAMQPMPVDNNNNNELSLVVNKINYLYSRYLTTNYNKDQLTTLHKLNLLSNLFNNTSNTGYTHKLFIMNKEKDRLISKFMQMDILTTKLLSFASSWTSKQKALKIELLQFKGESIELKILARTRLLLSSEDNNKQQEHKRMQENRRQLQDQEQLNMQQLNKKRELEDNIKEMETTQLARLNKTIKEKSREIDEQDVKISRIRDQMRSMQTPSTTKYIPPPELDPRQKEALQAKFSQKEQQWTSHTHHQEDEFDALLENFDRLTNAAIEFDSHRMKYDRQIDRLNANIITLQQQLLDEQVKKIGYNDGGAPTTASLRKEFRSLVADLKIKHQQRMDREEREIKHLHQQLKQLQDDNDDSVEKKLRGCSIAVQTS